MNNVLKILQDARNIISDPRRWTQKPMALSAFGFRVEADDPRACCWCSLGAVYAVTRKIMSKLLRFSQALGPIGAVALKREISRASLPLSTIHIPMKKFCSCSIRLFNTHV